MQRRAFIRNVSAAALVASIEGCQLNEAARREGERTSQRDVPTLKAESDEEIAALIEKHRPSKSRSAAREFKQRVGSTHVAGKYHLTLKPYLIEGAEALLQLGARVGKFYFSHNEIAHDYPFNSRWPKCDDFVALAKTDYFQQLFALPFSTFVLTAHTTSEGDWRGNPGKEFYENISQRFFDITAFLYRELKDRPITIIFQNWEGDWFLRGGTPQVWRPPLDEAKAITEKMQLWFAARQEGVSRARAAASKHAKCRIAHAVEINRVLDAARGIPTMLEWVLPHVEVDIVSYSGYDGMQGGPTFFRCIKEIQKRARTGPLFGKHAVYIGEMGIPENEHPEDLDEPWDKFIGAAFAAGAHYAIHWQLYCNELNPKMKPAPMVPIKRNEDTRGFWLIRPDGSLGQAGRYFKRYWGKSGS